MARRTQPPLLYTSVQADSKAAVPAFDLIVTHICWKQPEEGLPRRISASGYPDAETTRREEGIRSGGRKMPKI